MKNPFEHLRRDTRSLLPDPWHSYPVISKGYEVVEVYKPRSSRDYVNLFVAVQDGRWVCGIRYEVGDMAGSFLPGRKWGDFATHEDAILFTIGGVRAALAKQSDGKSKAAVQALTRAIITYRDMQLDLF